MVKPTKSLVEELDAAVEATKGNPLLGALYGVLTRAKEALAYKVEAKEAIEFTSGKDAYKQLLEYESKVRTIVEVLIDAEDERAKNLRVKDWRTAGNDGQLYVEVRYDIHEDDWKDGEKFASVHEHYEHGTYATITKHLYLQEHWLWSKSTEWLNEAKIRKAQVELAQLDVAIREFPKTRQKYVDDLEKFDDRYEQNKARRDVVRKELAELANKLKETPVVEG